MSTRSAKKKDVVLVKREEVLKAIVILDLLEPRYLSLKTSDPVVTWPVGTVSAVRLCLLSLYLHGGITRVILVSEEQDRIEQMVKDDFILSNDMSIEYMRATGSSCVGDVLREVYEKRLIYGDFVLLDKLCLSTVHFNDLAKQFKALQKKNRSLVGAICLAKRSPPFTSSGCTEDHLSSVVLDKSGKIRMYGGGLLDSSFVSSTGEVGSETHTDLVDCHACIGTEHLLSVFADNFDYMSISDAIKGLLVDEEISGDSMCALRLGLGRRHVPLTNLTNYMQANFDFLNDRFHPMRLDMFSQLRSRMPSSRCSLFFYDDDVIRHCKEPAKGSVLVSSRCQMGSDCVLSDVVIGSYCTMGENVVLRDCVIWDNVSIGNGCELRNCIVANNVTVGDSVRIGGFCVIGSGVVLPKGTVLPPRSVVVRSPDGKFSLVKLDDGEAFGLWGEVMRPSTSEEEESTSTPEDDRCGQQEGNDDLLGDEETIAEEVFGTVRRGLDEHLAWDKVVLELNCLKHAYNIPIRDLIEHIVDSVFRLPMTRRGDEPANPSRYASNLRDMFPRFERLVRNYAKDEDTQVHMIYALETTALRYEEIGSSSLLIHTMLYEHDVIEEPAIMRYYRNPLLKMADEQEVQKVNALRRQVEPFLHWLETADEETDEEAKEDEA